MRLVGDDAGLIFLCFVATDSMVFPFLKLKNHFYPMDPKEQVRQLFDRIEMLTPAERELIVDQMIVDEFEKGTTLLRQGQVSTRCYYVLQGCIREYSLVDGADRTNAFYTEGDGTAQFIGDGKDEPSKHFLECLEDCVLMICSESMESQMRELVPRLDEMIQIITKQKIAETRAEMMSFIHSSPEERYVHLMAKKPTIFNRVPHHQIASYLGMQPQSLSRIRKRVFEKETRDSNGYQV